MYSKGISWIGDCRIPFVDDKDEEKNTNGLSRFTEYRGKRLELGYGFNGGETYNINSQGRFPANILVSDDMLNDGVITKVQDNLKEQTKQYKGGNFGGGLVKNNFYFGYKGSNSRYYDIDKWFDNLIDG